MTRVFLPWDRPLLPQAVELLATGWSARGPLDLSDALVIVPTRQSGRRLREALAAAASARDQAVFPPRVSTPEGWLMEQAGPNTATRVDSLLAWARVFMGANLADFEEVFPVRPPEQNFSWALRVAREFARLKNSVSEGCLAMGEIAARGGPDFPETARWVQLGILEELYTLELERLGKLDFRAALDRAQHKPGEGDLIKRMFIVGVPDPAAAAPVLWAQLARTVPVTVAIFAAPAEEENFDRWGRPNPGWRERILDLPHFFDRVHLRGNPLAQAEYIASIAKLYSPPLGQVGVGVLDPELLAPIAGELGETGIVTFDPEGKTQGQGRFFHLLSCLLAVGTEPTFSHVRELGRCPDFLEFARGRAPTDFSAARWLAGLDRLAEKYLVRDLDAARVRALEMQPDQDCVLGLSLLAELGRQLRTGTFVESVQAVLGDIFAGRRLEPNRPADAEFQSAVEGWNDLLQQCGPEQLPAGVTRAEWWQLVLALYAEGRQVDNKPPDAVDLLGWLELLWEDAPHLLIAGGNDGLLPEPVVSDSFLPESFRARVGLTTNATRMARDAYILQALVKCRQASGRVDIVYGKFSAEGNPLRPSRLLLLCADAELPERVHRLFGAPPASAAHLAWQRAWPLRVPDATPPVTISATGLGRYLLCPFRFYLRRVLKMEPAELGKTELNAAEFGSLCHAVLEVGWRDPGLRASAEVGELREAYWAELERLVRQRWGAILDLPLRVQVDSARQRLAAAAALEIAERGRGWRTREIEQGFSLPIAGLTVEGRIDRIDQNEVSGAWRVLDYKTFDTAKSPEKAHLEPRLARPHAKDWAVYRDLKKERAWVDVQLPLYRRACAHLGKVEVGYFNLPKATTQTRISLWEDLDGELGASADHCIESACAAIARGEFWPPNENVDPDRDDYLSLFHQGVAASVERESAS